MNSLKPTNDFIFKKLFGKKGNEDILKDLLESILTDIKIEKLEIRKDVTLEKEIITNKLGILDIVATLNDNTIVNIEIQVRDFNNTIERSIFYETGLIHSILEVGENYEEIPRTISIWITKYDLFEEGPFHEKAVLKRDYENIVLTDKLELHYIQLDKFRRKCKRISSKLEEWLTFIDYENMEAISMIENEKVKKAEEEFEYLTGDEYTKRLAFLRNKAIWDERDAKSKGKKEGIQEGKKEEKIEIAKKMLAKNMDIQTIIELTELTKEEIEKLK